MDSIDHYIIDFLVSKPPKMSKLVSYGHERPKTRRRNKENENHGKKELPKWL